jgi:hypothetical protein
MRIKKSQQHLVSNNETSRLPYWVDDGYDDIQRTESQKHIMDIYGRFPESENQLPYNDDDYQALEYQYQDQFHNPDVKTPPFNTENDPDRKPKDCLDFWNQLFRGFRGGAFTASVNRMEALRKYSELCPVEYATKLCCRKGLRVHGPTNNELDSEASFTFTLTRPSGVKKCEYDFWATKGDMRLGGTYKAPKVTEETYDLMGVRPFLSDDKGNDCLTWKVKIKPKTDDCLGRVAVTAPTMVAGASQTLTVQGWRAGEVYSWSTTTGSLDVATGNSVVYTAPATNPNCANNPTITLTCGGNVVDTVQIAIRANSFDYNKAAYYITVAGGPGTVVGPYVLRDCEYKVMLMPVRCDGSSPSTWDFPTCGSDYANPYTGTCPHCAVLKYDPPGCWGNWAVDRVTSLDHAMSECAAKGSVNTSSPRYVGIPCGCANGTVYDVRTAKQKADGCCPAELL